jgi:hypothetical protein
LNSIAERTLLESLLHKPFNSDVNLVGPKVEGSKQTYHVVTKGDGFVCRTDPAADEVGERAREPAVNSTVNDE